MSTDLSPRRISWEKIAAVAMVLMAGVTLAVHVAGAFAFFDRSAAFIAFPANQDYGEGPILYQLAAVRAGETMYHPIADPPYGVSNYPPVFHLATWLMTAIVDDPLAAGRLVSFLAALASSLLIFTLVYGTLGRDHSPVVRAFAGALASLFFLAHYSIVMWSAMARTDMLALALGLLGMQIFVLSIRRQSLAYLYGLTFVLAAFTKQNMIAAAIATFATAFLLDRRQTYVVFFVSVLAGLIMIAVLQATSDGQFLLHAFLYNLNDFRWNQFGRAALQFVILNPVELLLLFYGLSHLFVDWRRSRRGGHIAKGRWTTPDIPLILFSSFVAASLLNVISFVKYGAAANYFMEFGAAGSLLLGMITVRVTTYMRTRGHGPGYVTHSLLVITGLFILCWHLNLGWDYKYRHPYKALVPYTQRVLDLAASVDGPVISEDMVLLYKTGKPLFWKSVV